MLEALYQWFVSIVSWILSWFGVSLPNRSVGGAVQEGQESSQDSTVEAPSVYSMSTSEPQVVDA